MLWYSILRMVSPYSRNATIASDSEVAGSHAALIAATNSVAAMATLPSDIPHILRPTPDKNGPWSGVAEKILKFLVASLDVPDQGSGLDRRKAERSLGFLAVVALWAF